MQRKQTIVVLILCFVMLLGGCAREDKYVASVKTGHAVNYPAVTIGEAFEKFFADPKWSHFKSNAGQEVVEFTGKCKYQEVDVTAKIQFVFKDEKSFETQFLSFNDIPQNMLVMGVLLAKVYDNGTAEKNAEVAKKMQAHANQGNSATDQQAAQTLLYGNWGIYATDWVKYKFNASNLRIVSVEAVDPNGESKIWVDTLDSKSGKWSGDYWRTFLEIKYNNKIKKHEMTITRRGNANGNILNDADAKKKFVKVPFE